MKNNDVLNKQRGQRLSECRKQTHLSQEQLSDKTGYSIQTISYIENGKRGMSTDAARIFSNALNVRMEYLLCDDECKTELHLFKQTKRASEMEQEIMDMITGLGYLPMSVEGDVIAHISPSDADEEHEVLEEYDIVKIEKIIIATPEQKIITCAEKEYRDLIDDIYDFVNLRMEQFSKRSALASREERKIFVEHFTHDEDIDLIIGNQYSDDEREIFLKNHLLLQAEERKDFLDDCGLTEDDL